MRAEVRAVRARAAERGDTEFSVADLDSMSYCLAAMKEVLRLHPIVYQLARVAGRDDVLPLSQPLTTADGTVVNEIAVPKGTTLTTEIWAYNRMTEIWGPDAAEFRPERWTEASPERKKQMMDSFAPFSIGPR